MTAGQLMRRLRSRPEMAYRLRDPEIVPIGPEEVLKGLLKLAAAEGGDVITVHPTLNPGGVPRMLLHHLRKAGSAVAEQQVERHIEALERAEVLRRTDGAITLILPAEQPRAAPRAAESGDLVRLMPNSLGPRGALTDGQWEALEKARKDGLAAQARGDAEALRDAWRRAGAIRPNLLKHPGQPRRAGPQREMLFAVPGSKAASDIGRDMDIRPISEAISEPGIADIELASKSHIEADIDASRVEDDDDDSSESISGSSSSSISDMPRERPISDIPPAISTPAYIGQPISEAGAQDAERYAGVAALSKSQRAALSAAATQLRCSYPDQYAAVFDRMVERAAAGQVIQDPAEYLRRACANAGSSRRIAGDSSPPTQASPRPAAEPLKIEPDPGCPSDLQDDWRRVREQLLNAVGRAEYRSWLLGMRCRGEGDDGLRLTLPTKVKLDWVKKNYDGAILRAWRSIRPAIKQLDFGLDEHLATARPERHVVG